MSEYHTLYLLVNLFCTMLIEFMSNRFNRFEPHQMVLLIFFSYIVGIVGMEKL
ncbi:hypothetical protein BD408DRAFT_420124 [Parasitella parasitica]|nr:hypothetical protein BD408DRAFT_420124 [Parasitella parasitica]